MSWPRKSLFLALFLLSSPWGSADTITVNTTTDDNADNSLCSLREAVEYFNRGKPVEGYKGCKAPAEDSATLIKLPADANPYIIDDGLLFGAIVISSSVTISGDGAKGDAVTTVQVEGAHRAFVINFDPSYEKPACAAAVPANCSPDADASGVKAPELDPESDTSDATETVPDLTNDAAGDYLTFSQLLELTGTIQPPAGGHPADRSYVIRIYDNPKTGAPVYLGEQKITPLLPDQQTSPLPWRIRTRAPLAPGVHYLTYTTQILITSTSAVAQAESAHSKKLTVAVYPRDVTPQVTLAGLVLKGGKADCTTAPAVTCATDINGPIQVNDPGDADYDPYALTYQNFVAGTTDNGGVIFNNETLTLTDMILQDGEAQGKGGGVYLSAAAGMVVSNVEIRENQTGSGAAIYAERNALIIAQSLITANGAPGSTQSIVEVGDYRPAFSFAATAIYNSTFSGNNGLALSLRDNTAASTATTVFLDNLTVVLNTAGGIDFNNSDIVIRNSIIAGNQDPDPAAAVGDYLDCIDTATALITYSLIVTGDGCPPDTNPSTNGNRSISDGKVTPEDDYEVKLMADSAVPDCRNSLTGILCPLADHGGTTFVHMPRLLPTYNALSESPLINKAGTDCSTGDQRSQPRLPYACDMGAVEVQEVASDSFTNSGGVIKYGGKHDQFLGYDLADEELLPASLCPVGQLINGLRYPPAQWADTSTALALAKIVGDSYNRFEPGCPWLVTRAGRGDVRFERFDPVTGVLMAAGQGYYTYQPHYNFHGFDRFEMRVVTTLSKLNPLLNDRSRLIRASVVVEPGTEMASQKLSGAFDGWGVLLLGMLGLGGLCRRQA